MAVHLQQKQIGIEELDAEHDHLARNSQPSLATNDFAGLVAQGLVEQTGHPAIGLQQSGPQKLINHGAQLLFAERGVGKGSLHRCDQCGGVPVAIQ